MVEPNQIPPKGRAKVPPGTVEHPEGAESLAALTAGWPPCKKEETNVVFLSKWLNDLGVKVEEVRVIADEQEVIVK